MAELSHQIDGLCCCLSHTLNLPVTAGGDEPMSLVVKSLVQAVLGPWLGLRHRLDILHRVALGREKYHRAEALVR